MRPKTPAAGAARGHRGRADTLDRAFARRGYYMCEDKLGAEGIAAFVAKSKAGIVFTTEACTLHAALEGFYAKHAPEKVANVEDLLARVYGGTRFNGGMVGGVL